jgi:dTDP-4-amino-4,6-dideoxygalactose transaminase
MNVPFIDLKKQYLNLKVDIDFSVKKVFDNSDYIMGSYVKVFETKIKKYLNQYAISCGSGSDALYIALKALGIKKGDEVITTPFTFFATAGAIINAGGTPVFVDIDEDTFNIDVNKIKKVMTDKTFAIIPVHLFGQPCNMSKIFKLSDGKCFVIEDACQAIGSEYKNKKVGTFGHISCFSFFPTKNLGGVGDGGLISTNHKYHKDKIRALRIHGANVKYYHEYVGINSRLDTIQAAVLNVKFNYLDEWNDRRIEIAKLYNKGLKEYVKIPKVIKGAKHVYHQYCVIVKNRKHLKTYLNNNDIACGIYYPVPLHRQKSLKYLGYKEGDFPNAENVSKEILSLPIYPEMTNEQVEYVITKVREFYEE